MELNTRPDLTDDQQTLYGSFVTSLPDIEDLVERLPRWDMHPERKVTHRFPLAQAATAYATMDGGTSGKVAIVFDL